MLVRLLADDALGAKRERYVLPLPRPYVAAFQAIDSDPNNVLAVATLAGKVVGMMQITFIPSLTYQGGWRALIEGVRIASSHRSGGLGKQFFAWAIARARKRGCHMVQLTTDKTRVDSQRFYTALGFEASHEGMKLHLDREQSSDGPLVDSSVG